MCFASFRFLLYKPGNSKSRIPMRITYIFFVFILTMNSALAQERQWTLDASEREAFLVFGVPDTDDVGLSFWCEIGKPKISVFAPVPHSKLAKDQKIKIDLKIGTENFNIIAKASQTPGTTAASVEALVDHDGTVMKAVTRAQQIAVKALGHTANYPLVDADVDGLLRVCSGTVDN
jgi:hypothetical protein